MLSKTTGILISYLVGSFPTAYIFARLIKGVDIRAYGSGNVGATNAMRLLGKPAGITVLLLDILKGFAAVVVLGGIFLEPGAGMQAETMQLLFGIACILGHSYTVFLRFKGGKGVATSLGVLIGLAAGSVSLRVILAMVLLVWIAVFVLSRVVSLASISAAAAFPVFVLIYRQPPALVVASLFLSALVVYRHKSNIRRLMRGEEKRIK